MMGRSVIRSSAVGLFDVGNPQKYVEKMKAVIQEKNLIGRLSQMKQNLIWKNY